MPGAGLQTYVRSVLAVERTFVHTLAREPNARSMGADRGTVTRGSPERWAAGRPRRGRTHSFEQRGAPLRGPARGYGVADRRRLGWAGGSAAGRRAARSGPWPSGPAG